jgi:hypothetical protein
LRAKSAASRLKERAPDADKRSVMLLAPRPDRMS